MSESEVGEGGKKRDRSPPFPFIGLGKAVERTAQLFTKARRAEVRIADAAADWGLGAKSSVTMQTVGALLAFGLLESSGMGDGRKIKVTEEGRRILEDTRPGVKERLLAEAALKPKLVALYAERWKSGRPDDHHSISELKFESHLTHDAATNFLRVFDETIRFAQDGRRDVESDKGAKPDGVGGTNLDGPPPNGGGEKPSAGKLPNPPAPRARQEGQLMNGERELTTGLLSKSGASFRLIVSGRVGTKEIDRLIRKLQIDREILADDENEEASKTPNLDRTPTEEEEEAS